ncbi:MAG: hypothetical protein ABI035_05565 [Gemmatimonadaceae bacterium]
MPSYNTATVASALGVTPKWLDNLLSHNDLDGSHRISQGVARRLSFATVTILSLAKELIDTVGMKAPAAIELASQLLNSTDGDLIVSPRLRIKVQADSLQANVLDSLARAVEIAPSPRRGRPPKR